jgi:TRAP-type C4-dicarboxylate transport system permease small subunit
MDAAGVLAMGVELFAFSSLLWLPLLLIVSIFSKTARDVLSFIVLVLIFVTAGLFVLGGFEKGAAEAPRIKGAAEAPRAGATA